MSKSNSTNSDFNIDRRGFMKASVASTAAVAAGFGAAHGAGKSAFAAPLTSDSHPTFHRTVQVDGLDIFYREAGPEGAPTILLLHGFPTSSHIFRNLIPALSAAARLMNA